LLGLEGSGTVAAIGSQVQTLQVGDRVIGLGQSFLSSSITISAEHVAKIPNSLTFEDAATMPLAFCTAIYALRKVANLQRGQSILIHSTCGSVGLAAVQLSQMAGAEVSSTLKALTEGWGANYYMKVFCTVDNDDSTEYLITSFDIPRNHIFHSGNASFLPELMNMTKNLGVDVVLNSLSGDLLHASWKCVAPRGKVGGLHTIT
jgi:NADPH:quinone reductase-like Zn-dependent oxidoreductase